MDRQDIDALLIGGLYGELLPADEARLAAHLESHPTDRSAFEGLKSARQAVRESRIFEAQLEPPQALSALLLQEAHRRAPREAKDGWFQRLVRGFAAHPALAAAAMLAIVLGFAGLMSRHGAGIAARERAETPASGSTAAVAPVATPPTPPAAPAEGVAAGSGYVVGLAEKTDEAKQEDVPQEVAGERQQASAGPRAPEVHHAAHAVSPLAKDKTAGIIVRGQDREPKDLDGMVSGGEGFGAAASDRRAAKLANEARSDDQAPMPAPPPGAPAQAGVDATRIATLSADRPAPVPGAPAPTGAAAQAPGSPWARARHADAVTAVQRGDCAGAARIALAVKQREPAFYDQVMATDRALVRCRAYIASAIERDAEAGKAAARPQAADQR